MPNTCYNCLYVYGARADRDEFLSSSLTIDYDNGKIVDEPQFDLNRYIELTDKYSSRESIDKWGLKWNCHNTIVKIYGEFDCIYFLTPRNPYNSKVQKAIASKHHNLRFKLLFLCSIEEIKGYYLSEYNKFTKTICFLTHSEEVNDNDYSRLRREELDEEEMMQKNGITNVRKF